MQGELRLCRLLANGLDVPCAPGQGGGAERALLGSTRVLPQPQRSLHPPRRDSVTPMLGAHSNSARTGQLAASAIRACVADDSRATGQRERAQEAREGATVRLGARGGVAAELARRGEGPGAAHGWSTGPQA
jgi:hypothetical protein